MKPKVLFISSRPLYPVVGGDQIRTAQQLELLAERCTVDIVYLTNHDDSVNLYDYFDKVGEVKCFKISKLNHYIHTLRFIFNRRPLQVNYYYIGKVARWIRKVYERYDMVFCNNIRTAQYVLELNGPIKCLDFVDAISMNYDKARRQAKGLKRLIYEIDYKRCREYEKKCLKAFSSCAVISDIDNKYITECP